MNSDRCRVDEETNNYLDAQDALQGKPSYDDVKSEVVINFKYIARKTGLEIAICWLVGAFKQEGIDNAADVLTGESNDYFEALFEAKASEIVDERKV